MGFPNRPQMVARNIDVRYRERRDAPSAGGGELDRFPGSSRFFMLRKKAVEGRRTPKPDGKSGAPLPAIAPELRQLSGAFSAG
jgi:hypothetical protein